MDTGGWGQHGEPWGPRMESLGAGDSPGDMSLCGGWDPYPWGTFTPQPFPACASKRWVGCREEESGILPLRSRTGDGG